MMRARWTVLQFLFDRIRKNESGAAAVEYGLIAPVFVVAVFVMIEVSRVGYAKVEFDYAMSNATRYGIVYKSANTAAVKNAVSANFVLLNSDNLTTLTMTEVTNADSTKTATLTASYQIDLLLPLSEYSSVTISKSVSFLRPE